MSRLFQQATPAVLGVACVFSGVMMTFNAGAETTSGLKLPLGAVVKKSVPEYLVISPADDFDPKVRSLETLGKLSEAIMLLENHAKVLADRRSALKLEQEAFRLTNLKRDFSTTAGEMLRKIQERIPDATEADLDHWTVENELSWIPVDGEVRYFRREPGILLRINEVAKKRAEAHESGDPASQADEGFSFNGHLRAALDAARDKGTSVVLPVRFTVTHSATLKPGKVPAGQVVRCWLPLPREDSAQQGAVKIISMTPQGKVGADVDSAHRTVYFEQKAAADGSADFELKFEYTCAALVPDLNGARAELTDKERQDLRPFLEGRHPHLDITDDVTSLSRVVVGDQKNIVGKAYAIWSWLDENVKWCPEMEYAVMPDIVAKVMAERRGDCGTQALTFVALCRAAGVPARWQSGWVTKPGHWNMHDWAEFYAPGIGWVPADPSVGRQKSDDPEVREFLFGHMDAYRMIANNDYGRDFSPAKSSFRSDPVDNQRGEMEWSGGNLYFDDWSYDVQVKQETLD